MTRAYFEAVFSRWRFEETRAMPHGFTPPFSAVPKQDGAHEGADMNWERRLREMVLAGGAMAAAGCAANPEAPADVSFCCKREQ
jgi:hypothetical protein